VLSDLFLEFGRLFSTKFIELIDFLIVGIQLLLFELNDGCEDLSLGVQLTFQLGL